MGRPEYHYLEFPADLRGNLAPVAVLLVPAEAAWMVPVVLQFGGFNGCFEPPYHSAAIRSWQRRYGAEMFAMDETWLEFIVARPPTTREDAMELATELVEYAESFDDRSLSRVAASLVGSRIWWAWWD